MSRYFNSVDKKNIWENDNGYCGICGLKARRNNWEADHIIPWSKGGETEVENGQVAHPWCNREKLNRERAVQSYCHMDDY